MPTVADPLPLVELYEKDETAWLEQMAALAERRQTGEMDFENLAEFLTSMAKRDKRELVSRLRVLLVHLLKWDYQPDKRTPSWNCTIIEQRDEFSQLVESATLYNHAEEVMDKTYTKAVELASAETGLPESTFPPACPWTVDQLTAED